MNEEQKRQFFAMSTRKHQTVSMGGKKVAFANFPEDVKKKILEGLASKDETMALGHKGILPGIKIDGKQVTRENIYEFEVKKPELRSEAKTEEKKVEKKPVKRKVSKKTKRR